MAEQKQTLSTEPSTDSISGVDAFISGVSALAWRDYITGADTSDFVDELSDRYAYIRLRDVWRPKRFLQQMAGAPPMQLGNSGFRRDLIDDWNPARHYTALLFVGYHLPKWLAMIALYLWEIAGFIRYHGAWSWPDIRSGLLGIQHGRLVRMYGCSVLPSLVAATLVDKDSPEYSVFE